MRRRRVQQTRASNLTTGIQGLDSTYVHGIGHTEQFTYMAYKLVEKVKCHKGHKARHMERSLEDTAAHTGLRHRLCESDSSR